MTALQEFVDKTGHAAWLGPGWAVFVKHKAGPLEAVAHARAQSINQRAGLHSYWICAETCRGCKSWGITPLYLDLILLRVQQAVVCE